MQTLNTKRYTCMPTMIAGKLDINMAHFRWKVCNIRTHISAESKTSKEISSKKGPMFLRPRPTDLRKPTYQIPTNAIDASKVLQHYQLRWHACRNRRTTRDNSVWNQDSHSCYYQINRFKNSTQNKNTAKSTRFDFRKN